MGRDVKGFRAASLPLTCSPTGAYSRGMARPKMEEARRHSGSLRVRLLPDHETLIREAAAHAVKRKGSGDLSDWMREVLVAAARRELKRSEGEED